MTPPDPKTEPGDEEVQAEEEGKVDPELAAAAETEVTVGGSRWKWWAILAFAGLGWPLALLLLVAGTAKSQELSVEEQLGLVRLHSSAMVPLEQ